MLANSKSIALLLCGALMLFKNNSVCAFTAKDNIFADVLLTELLNRMDNDMQAGYYDVDDEADLVSAAAKDNVDLVSRSEFPNLCPGGEGNSDCLLQSANPPSLRDQEFLQHSSLWGHQYMSGGMGEVPNRYNTIVKTDASLPAYCNPPNPCPEGYDVELPGSCIVDFENTAIFSREFQAAQECTCDSEHMFDCADQESDASSNSDMNSAVEKFLMHQFQQNDHVLDNSVIKKANTPDLRMEAIVNPFLQGDRLPIAAKKGNLLFN